MLAQGGMKASCLSICCLLAFAGLSHAQERQLNWAERMFSELNCDLGTVAHRSELRHRLEIRNIYEETVYVRNVKKNCGCTEFTLVGEELGTFESAYIDLNFNTTDFLNEKQSSIDVTVAFEGGGERIVHIPIRYFVRQDVVFTPGSAEFAEVTSGLGASASSTFSTPAALPGRSPGCRAVRNSLRPRPRKPTEGTAARRIR